MVDTQLIGRLMAVLDRLGVPVTVQPRYETEDTAAEPITEGGMLVLALNTPPIRLLCPRETPGGRQLLMLAGALAMKYHSDVQLTPGEVYTQAMLGILSAEEILTHGRRLQMPMKLQRCLILFRSEQPRPERILPMLQAALPLQERDVLTEPEKGTAVLIKDLRDFETPDDVLQLSLALWDNLTTDVPGRLQIGVSPRFTGLQELQGRYQQAQQAIAVGSRFHEDESVFIYDRLVLERFLLETSPEVRRRYYSQLFSPATEALFNEEMMYTIDMFMRQDLNLSETARQLYIHRNTLVYRLDKVQKATGINLRSFKDAMAFRLLTEMKHCDSRADE